MSLPLDLGLSQATVHRLRMLFDSGTLPEEDTARLIEIWHADSPTSLERLDRANVLVSMLTSYAPAFRAASAMAAEVSHMADAERLELAGLPLKLPHSGRITALEDLPAGSRLISISLPTLDRVVR